MQVILIGLGRMGANMARRWARGGVNVVAFDQSAEARAAVTEAGFRATGSIAEALAAGDRSVARVVWLMLPAGDVT